MSCKTILPLLLLGLMALGALGDDCRQLDSALSYEGVNYLFFGKKYVTLDKDNNEVSFQKSDGGWGGLGKVNAALTWPETGDAYFFKGRQFSYYSVWWGIVGSFPNSKWDDKLVDGVDAAGNIGDKSYFTRGCDYFVHHDGEYEGPKSLKDVGLPCDLDAAISLGDDHLTFIKHDQMWDMSSDGTVSGPTHFGDVIGLESVSLCAE